METLFGVIFLFDLTNFNVRNKPHTDEQLLQKIKSLQGFERFWYEVLSSKNFKGKENSSKLWTGSVFITTADLLHNYKEYNKGAEKYQPLQVTQVLETIKKICPKSKINIREFINTFQGKQQLRGVRLPCIGAARQDFCDYIGHEINWGDDDSDDKN